SVSTNWCEAAATSAASSVCSVQSIFSISRRLLHQPSTTRSRTLSESTINFSSRKSSAHGWLNHFLLKFASVPKIGPWMGISLAWPHADGKSRICRREYFTTNRCLNGATYPRVSHLSPQLSTHVGNKLMRTG